MELKKKERYLEINFALLKEEQNCLTATLMVARKISPTLSLTVSPAEE